MLRRIWREIPLAVSAMLIAFTVWLIAVQEAQETTKVKVAVELIDIPGNVDAQKVTQEVYLWVQHPREERGYMVERNFGVQVPVREAVPRTPADWPAEGEKIDYPLTVSNVVLRDLPSTVNVRRFVPDSVVFQASLFRQEMSVEVPLAGELPSYLELSDGRVVPQPGVVEVTGSKAALDALVNDGITTLSTQPVDLSRIAKSDMLPRDLIVPSILGIELVRPSDARVNVNVAVRDKQEEKTIADVPVNLAVVAEGTRAVARPAAVSVVVRGSQLALNSIDAGSFEFQTLRALPETRGERQQVGLRAVFRNRVPANVRDKLTIAQVVPSAIEVEFVAETPQVNDAPTTATAAPI